MTYQHLPRPPRAIRQITVAQPRISSRIEPLLCSDRIEEYPIYALQHTDSNGCQTTQVLSLTEYLWHVIQQHCRQSCHTLRTSLRGDWSCTIKSGHHDAKRWHYSAETWDHLIYKITLDLLPGYWTPPWTALHYTGNDPIGKSLARLLPGESIAIDNKTMPNNPIMGFENSLTGGGDYLDRILEGISGSAYHLVIRPEQSPGDFDYRNRRNITVVQRLQHSLEGSTTRAYVSPDRRHHYTQNPQTGLYHLKV